MSKSKYEELVQSYSNARKSFRDYEETCRDFARDLVFGMVEYFEWPKIAKSPTFPWGKS